LIIGRLLESYQEFVNPESFRAIERTRSLTTTATAVPVIFPESYPFSLVANLPKASGTSLKAPAPNEALFYPALGETAIVFLVLVLSSPRKYILNFLESSLEIEGKDKFVGLLHQFFKTAISILDNEAFPKNWLNVNILAHKVLVKMMDSVATIMERDFIPDHDSESPFDSVLWKEGFFMLLKLLSSDQLVIEEFTPQVSSLYQIVAARCDPLSFCRNAVQCGVWRAIFVAKVQLSCCGSG
jgi:dedicator of cytokinesis protein 3